MKELYVKFDIPNLEVIKEEVKSFFKNNSDLLKPDNVEEYFVQMNMDNVPTLRDFLNSRKISEIVETSTCFLPGHTNLHTHIDGLKRESELVPEGKLKSNMHVLVIPVENTSDTINYWFDNNDVTDNDERIVRRVRPEPPYDFYISFCEKELEPIGSTTIDKPTFIKSDIYHTVHNNGDKTRLVFIVRFYEEQHYELSDIFNIEGLEC